MGLTKYKLGELIESSDLRNRDRANRYTKDDVKGISTDKEFIETKANLKNVSLSSYRIVDPYDFAYVSDTSRRGDKISLAFNDIETAYIVSSIYTIFKITKRDLLEPYFLFMYFNRAEFDRFSRFNSWGSARETFSWKDFCDIEIDLPSLDIQKKYVAVYKALLANQKAYEEGLEDLKLACDTVIDKLKHKITKVSMKNLVEEIDVRNNNMVANSATGVNIEKQFITSKAKVTKKALANYKLVAPNEFVFSGMQTGRDKCIRIALNNEKKYKAVSPAYNVIRVKEGKAVPEYIMLWFSRNEADRYGWFLSDSSIRANLELERFFDIEIPLPSTLVQQSLANIFSVYTQRKEINEKLKTRLKNICPILIKGAMQEGRRSNGIC